ncbi:MAG: Gx transporter family protein [Clostridia bacterium]|nr:Gx transporter family protein [Clostridia bacterium]
MKAREITEIGVLCAIAAVLGYIEALLPPFVPVTGFKIGLANIAVMFALYRFGKKHAFFVMLVKVLITSLWFSGLNALIYSLFGGIFSWLAMVNAVKFKLSKVGVGMCGGVFHNIGQIVVACLVLNTNTALYFAPMLLPLGLVSGAFVGMVVRVLIKYTEKI